jgi:hypothetical protein
VGSHPANLLLRLCLELAALGAYGWWGYRTGTGLWRWVLMIALPCAAALLWVTFAVSDDPSRSGKTVVETPGWARLLLELAFFGGAVVALYHGGATTSALATGAIVILHYGLSYDRVAWLLKRRAGTPG